MDSPTVPTKLHNGLYTKEVPNKGKGLFCSVDIKEGDVILTERPLVACQFSWNRKYNYVACDNCMKSLETAQNMARRLASDYSIELPHTEEDEALRQQKMMFRCPQCQIPFCSEECYAEAIGKYHKVLCLGSEKDNTNHPLNRLEETWRKMHYPPETATVMLLCRIIAMVIQSDNPEKILGKFSCFFDRVVNEEQKISHKLLGAQFIEQLEHLRCLVNESLPTELMKALHSQTGFQSMFALIGQNGQGIGTSSLSQYVHNIDAMKMGESERESMDAFIDQLYEDIGRESGEFLNCEGSGLYQLQSCCNHSCLANAEVTFPYNNSTLVLVAVQDIMPDEEICICYLDCCHRDRSRHSRRKILRQNYLFECLCQRCIDEEEQPSETSSEEDEDDDDNEDEETEMDL